MNLTKCENGHFYDADKFAACPHCAQPGGGVNGPTVGKAHGRMPDDVNVTQPGPDINVRYPGGMNDAGNKNVTIPERKLTDTLKDENENKTIYWTQQDKGTDPVVGWLVCVEGAYYGESFKLKTGRNFIGRDSKMDIVLGKDQSVARNKHAIVLYEPKKREFLAQPGESRGLFYLNDDVVLMTEKLKRGDVLTLGNTKLMFVPCCGPDFGWDNDKKEV